MRLFIWRECLYECGSYGDIIVTADSVEEARKAVMAASSYAYAEGDCGNTEPEELSPDIPHAFIHYPGC